MVQNIQVSPERGVDAYPLSPMQQGMLFHSVEAGDPGVDVEQVVCELHEEINAGLFEAAWREVVARHAILRTGFHWSAGAEPRQVVQAPLALRPDFSVAEFGSEQEARRGLDEYLAEDRRRGFDLAQPPLLRVALLKGGAAHYWWVVTFHHLVLDGRAMIVAFREAMELHDAFVAGRRHELPPVRPYRAYIDWLQALDWTRAEKFWRGQLKGFTRPNTLGLERPAAAPAAGEPHGELAFRLSETATSRLRATARRHEVTMNTLLQAAWALLVSRYSRDEDVVFGAVRACRHIPVEGAGSMVGLFINTVPLRTQVPAAGPLGPWLQSLREQWIALRDHEHTPLMQIQQWSDAPRGTPLFETLFNYQEPSWDAALRALGGPWTKRVFDIRSQPNYPLAVDAYGAAALTVKLLYDRRQFADAAIARMLGHYRAVLMAIAADREPALAEISLLSPAERQQVLVGWNATAANYDRSTCVHQVVEQQAVFAPARLAVAALNGSLTYVELNRRANQVAHRLRLLGVGPESVVAVCMDRGLEMMVAWLGVLKAGGAFVPLDPTYPRDRLAFQLGDCGARVILVQPHGRAVLPPVPASTTVLDVRADGAGYEREPVENPPCCVGPHNLAYIIYTSGSTGQPKGVQIEHAALMNLVTWHQRTYGVTSEDRATQLASPAFDAAVWETWPYLASGASLFVPPDDVRISPAHLLPWMAEKRITLSFLPTPLAEAVLNEPWPAGMSLRALLTGGDRLQRPAPVDLPCALVNHYGPTECTVVATSCVVPPSADGPAPAIGRPIANTQAYVLDASLQPVPVGVPGELYLGGLSLARGYRHRATLTAEKFVPHPFVPASAIGVGDADTALPARLYRTGDLVRWRADGQLEFLGRIDEQVKIRGHRIELGEIAAALQRHPAVRECVVVARPGEAGASQLVAYVLTPAEAPSAEPAELVSFLRGLLPAYMVPAAFVALPAWPLTANGKIDRRALPAPEASAAPAPTDPLAPRTPVEQAVAQAWRDVLGRRSFGLNDNFFDLGGHSLLAAQVITRLNATLGGALSVRILFDQPTIAGLAREIELRLQRTSAPPPPAPRVRRRATRPEMELVRPD